MGLKLNLKGATEKLSTELEPLSAHQVMVVDDEEANLESLEYTLGKKYPVKAFSDAREALQVIDQGEDVSVIISDYQPVVDQLAGLLAQDLTLAKAGSGTEPGLLYAYQSVAKSLKNQAWPIVNGGENYNYAERKVAVDALLTAEQAMMRIESLSVASDKVLTGLQQSNAIIVQVLKDKDYAFSDIKAYAKDIRDLARIYRSLAAS